MNFQEVESSTNAAVTSSSVFKAKLVELFPDPIVIRSQVTKQSKGLISSRTLANYDSAPGNKGVPDRFILNGKVCYDRDIFIDWLVNRLRVVKNLHKTRSGIDEFL